MIPKVFVSGVEKCDALRDKLILCHLRLRVTQMCNSTAEISIFLSQTSPRLSGSSGGGELVDA